MEGLKKQQMYRMIWLSACLFLLLSVACRQPAKAATHSGTCGTNAKWNYNKKTKTLTISGTGEVVLNRQKKGYLEANIKPKKLVVKQGVTSITCYNNNHTFQYNEFHLDEVSLPNSLQSISGPLFMNCKIASLTIPKNVKQLDAIPFLFANIKEFKVNKKNKYYTVSKEGILFSKNQKTLLYYPKNCKQKKYEIPKSVTKIGDMAFYGNDFLQNIVFTKKIRTIGNGAFSYCHRLKKTNIQVTKVKQIQDYDGKPYGLRRYFGYWIWAVNDLSLENIICGYYNNEVKEYVHSDNRNYFGTFQGAVLTSFVMPDSMKYMGKQSLYSDHNNKLISVSKYNSVVLKKLVIGKNFEGEINGGKSGSDDRATTLDLHFTSWKDNKKSGKRTLCRLENIQVHKKNKKYCLQEQVLYSKNMDTIYYTSSSVKPNLTFGKKVRYIARGAFYANHSVKSVTLQGDVSQIHDSAFEDCSYLKTLKIQNKAPIERIGKSAFNYYNEKAKIAISGKIHYIGDSAFRGSGERDIDFSEVTYIGDIAFRGCTFKNQNLNINSSIEYIGSHAFYQCNLTTVKIYSTNALKIDSGAFCTCPELTTVTLYSDVSLNLGEEILEGSHALKQVTLSKNAVIEGDELIRYHWDGYELQYI